MLNPENRYNKESYKLIAQSPLTYRKNCLMFEPYTPNEFEFDALQDETIVIEPTRIHQAIKLSDSVQNEKQQWQAYLNALALLSFEQWLKERAPELSVNQKNCSILQPDYVGLIKAVLNLEIDEFKICLISLGTGMDEAMAIPKIAIEVTSFTAHFYIAIAVIEELEQARILGFIDHDELLKRLRSTNLQPEPNWTYRTPLNWLDRNLDNLLLSLRCIKPVLIPNQRPSLPTYSWDRLKEKVKKYQSEIGSSSRELWEIFTWEEATLLLTYPELFRPEKIQINSLVNVAAWLSDRLDEFAQQLSWVLLPSFNADRFRLQAATAMRSPLEELDDILTQLERSGTDIPLQARGAYQDLKLEDETLRLYAVTWSLLSPENTPLWKLLLILGGVEGRYPPHGTTLQVSDQTQVLVKQICDQQTDAPYLYVRVAGTWEDTFSVKITSLDSTSITLPPFAFHPQTVDS